MNKIITEKHKDGSYHFHGFTEEEKIEDAAYRGLTEQEKIDKIYRLNDEISHLESKVEYLKEENDRLQHYQWDNRSCIGYMIMAMKAAECTEEQIKKAIRSTNRIFDDESLRDAYLYYLKSEF